MSVLIKGMDMPQEGCKDCLLVKRGQVFDICPFLKREVNGNVERGGKPYDCPLVEVKTPHGRLIDADALKVKFTKTDANGINLELDRYALKCIDNATTIIEAEEGDNNE